MQIVLMKKVFIWLRLIRKGDKKCQNYTTSVIINSLRVDHKNHHHKINTRVQTYFDRQGEYIQTLKP